MDGSAPPENAGGSGRQQLSAAAAWGRVNAHQPTLCLTGNFVSVLICLTPTAELMNMRPVTCLLPVLALLTLCCGVQAAEREPLVVPEGTYLIDWQGEFDAAQRAKLQDWLRAVAPTLTLLHGSWPADTIRIELKPVNYDTALPFATVLRGRPEGVQFYVNANRPLEEFITDWTTYHELSHLFIPFPGRADLWFSEGLASYYQNILQVRAGLLTPAETRARFTAAFGRGAADTDDADLTLTELSRQMRKRGGFMRSYWSGALLFLEADIALRERTPTEGQPGSLDDVLREYGRCCRVIGGETTGRELVAEFDRIAGGRVFADLYERYAQSTAMPRYGNALLSPTTAEIFAGRRTW